MDWNDVEIVLASASPSRKLLFDRAGIPCEVLVSGVDETVPDGLSPAEVVEILAGRKARAVAPLCEGKAVIAADSVVSIDHEIIGKPKDQNDAERMIQRLSGRVHTIFTGVCIIYGSSQVVFSQKTDVEFYDLSQEEIAAYMKTGESLGKAGSYGIEGRGVLLIKAISGDYSNIVGLPLSETMRRLNSLLNQE